MFWSVIITFCVQKINHTIELKKKQIKYTYLTKRTEKLIEYFKKKKQLSPYN